jgi:phosphate-selective porin OprO and OprP
MKHSYLFASLFAFVLLLSAVTSRAQQTNDLLNILVKKGVISQHDADSIRADAAVKEQQKLDQDKANQHGVYIGSRALQLSGLIQTEYEGFQQKGVNNTFLLHRARLDVKGDINDNWSYEVYTEFAGVTPKLLDAYSTYKIVDAFKITAGQFKVPFSLESLIADSQLEFIDRSQVVNALAGRSTDVIGNQNGRDIGIDANGSFAQLDNKQYLFDYVIGVFNGAGYDVTTDNNSHKDIAGRLTIHPINNLQFSADFYNGQGNYILPGAKVATNNTRNREGIDARYVIGGLSLQAEYDKGTDATIKRDGWYGQASYFVLPKHLQLGVKYDTYDPNTVTINDATNIYTGAASWYFNDWAKFTLNYLIKHEDAPTQVPNNIFEAQLQLTF